MKNVELRDTMIKMMKLSQSSSFVDIMGDLDNFEKMMKTATAIIADTLNCASFVETLSTSKITTLKWPLGVSSINYISEQCLVIKKSIKKRSTQSTRTSQGQTRS